MPFWCGLFAQLARKRRTGSSSFPFSRLSPLRSPAHENCTHCRPITPLPRPALSVSPRRASALPFSSAASFFSFSRRAYILID